jgi:hypothetical protein
MVRIGNRSLDEALGPMFSGWYSPRMGARSNPVSGILASVLLAGIVLFTFWTYRGFGPISAVRRFHYAAARGDATELGEVVRQPVTAESAQLLRATVSQAAAEGWRFEVLRVDRPRPDRVLATVVYFSPDGRRAHPRVWVVEKREGETSWRINADATVNLFRQAMGI